MTRSRVGIVVIAVVVVLIATGGLVLALGGDDGDAAFCDQLNDIYRASSRAGQINLEDSLAVEDELRTMQARFDALSESAPGGVADDVEAVAAWADRVAQAALDNPRSDGFDRASALSVASDGAAALDGPLRRLDTYRAESC